MPPAKSENGTREFYAWAFRFTLGIVVTILSGLSFNTWTIIRGIEGNLNKAVNTISVHEHRITNLETNDKIHATTIQTLVNEINSLRERLIRIEDAERTTRRANP